MKKRLRGIGLLANEREPSGFHVSRSLRFALIFFIDQYMSMIQKDGITNWVLQFSKNNKNSLVL